MDLNDLRHRIRWGNVGRAGALFAAVALVALWPQLRSEPPALPEARAVPAAPAHVPAPEAQVPHAPAAEPPRAAPSRRSRARPKPRRAKRPRPAKHRTHPRAAPASVSAAAPAPARWFPAPTRAAEEFGPG